MKGLCARDWNRTSTFLRTADFESAASTNSATRASIEMGCNITFSPEQYQNFMDNLNLRLLK